MKQLTKEEFEDAPGLVAMIYTAGMQKTPVNPDMYAKAIRMYPQYFPDEIKEQELVKKAEKRFDAIPKEVKEKYEEEAKKAYDKAFKDVTMTNKFDILRAKVKEPKKFKEYEKSLDKANKAYMKASEELYNKHFKDYGLEV